MLLELYYDESQGQDAPAVILTEDAQVPEVATDADKDC
jgi:hypothetical protein